MKLTRRQLNRIIAESLGTEPVMEIKGLPKILNFGKMRKDLFALKDDIDNQELLDKAQAHLDDLQLKVDGGERKFLKGRYREAVTLLQAFKAIMNPSSPPTPAEVEKVIEKVPDEKPDTQPVTPPDWNPDPDPKVGWEYQNRDCVWFTRKKGTEKEYKLGHASGKPLERGGKFLGSIVKLNKAYPDLVKGCDPLLKKPTPKPGKKESSWPENAMNLIKTTKIPGDYAGIPEWKNMFQGACSNYLDTNGLSLKQFYQGMEPRDRVFTGVFEWLALEERQGGTAGRETAEALIDEVNEMSKEVSGKTKGLNNHDPDYNPLAAGQKQKAVAESLSRGALYRRRYYGRY